MLLFVAVLYSNITHIEKEYAK